MPWQLDQPTTRAHPSYASGKVSAGLSGLRRLSTSEYVSSFSMSETVLNFLGNRCGKGSFTYCRIYSPEKPAFGGSWKPGEFEEVKP